MTIKEMINKAIKEGYKDTYAESKVCQDIILLAISKSKFNKKITIKGGVVMSNISKEIRRATEDLDIDFIRYSLNNESIKRFIKEINCLENIDIKIINKIEKLHHEDYNGKRVFIEISDETGYSIKNKIDIGVHKLLDIKQEEYCFDIASFDESVNLLINSKEQIIAEKLLSLLTFKQATTRYKDIFDIWYLLQKCDPSKLKAAINKITLKSKIVSNYNQLIESISQIFSDKAFIKKVNKSNKNWTDERISYITRDIINKLKLIL